MLISQIDYTGKTTGTINGQNIMTISLKEVSQTNSVVNSITWAYGVVTGPGTASLSNVSDKDVALVIDNTQDIVVSITLTVTDTDGYTSQSRIRITKSGSNVLFEGLKVDSFILPNGLVEFTPLDNVVAINGTPTITTPAFTEYWFDKENDAVWDVQDNSGSIPTFSNTYTSTSVTAVVANTNSLVFNQVAFNAIIENPLELIVNSTVDCKTLTAYSETENYLSKLIGRGDIDNSEMTHLGVTLTTNCCTTGSIQYDLPPTYKFELSQGTYVQTGTYLVDYYGTGYNYEVNDVPFTLTGIDPSIVTSIVYTNRGESTNTTTITSFTDPISFNVEVLIETDEPNPPGYPVTGSQVSQTNTITILTTKGFTYVITYTLSDPFVTQMTLTIDSIVYEEYPCDIIVTAEPSNTILTLTSSAFNLSECGKDTIALPDGIYQITLNDSGISNETVTGCKFVDCETYCLIIKAIASGCDPSVGILYNALTYSDNCIDVSCQNLCDLYEILNSLLEECDCTLYKNNVKSTIPCGCK